MRASLTVRHVWTTRIYAWRTLALAALKIRAPEQRAHGAAHAFLAAAQRNALAPYATPRLRRSAPPTIIPTAASARCVCTHAKKQSKMVNCTFYIMGHANPASIRYASGVETAQLTWRQVGPYADAITTALTYRNRTRYAGTTVKRTLLSASSTRLRVGSRATCGRRTRATAHYAKAYNVRLVPTALPANAFAQLIALGQ